MSPAPSNPARPATLWLALVGLGLEALGLLVTGGWSVALAFLTSIGTSSLLALGAMFVLLGLLMVALASGVARGLRWARPASVAWQVLQFISGVSLIGQLPIVGVAVMVVAAVVLVGLFTPPTITWYEDRIERNAPKP